MYFRLKNLPPGGNNFKDFPENQLVEFCAQKERQIENMVSSTTGIQLDSTRDLGESCKLPERGLGQVWGGAPADNEFGVL